MGVTVLEDLGKDNLMVGSFEGLFNWNYKNGEVYDLIKKQKYIRPTKIGTPIGDYKISGFCSDFHGQNIVFDYEKGGINMNKGVEFIVMPVTHIVMEPCTGNPHRKNLWCIFRNVLYFSCSIGWNLSSFYTYYRNCHLV